MLIRNLVLQRIKTTGLVAVLQRLTRDQARPCVEAVASARHRQGRKTFVPLRFAA